MKETYGVQTLKLNILNTLILTNRFNYFILISEWIFKIITQTNSVLGSQY